MMKEPGIRQIIAPRCFLLGPVPDYLPQGSSQKSTKNNFAIHRRFGLGATFISEPYRRYYPYYAPLPISAQPQYWHYCTDPQGYYPYVTNCSAAWLPVVPQGPAP